MKKAFVKALRNEMIRNKDLYIMTGDMGYGVMDPIIIDFQDRFINVGICEQNMASMAAGMALEGCTIFTYSIGNFTTLRCLEQIRNDIAYHKANVKIVSVGGGFEYGALGMSHHATEDIAVMRAIPGIQIVCPGDRYEVKKAVEYAVEHNGPVYIRLGKCGDDTIPRSIDSIGKIAPFFKDENAENINIAIMGTGSVVNEIASLRNLRIKDVRLSLYSIPVIKPFDTDGLIKLCEENDVIITLEEHNVIGGLGSVVEETMVRYSCAKRLIKLGLQDQFATVVGSPEYLRDYYRINNKAVIETIKDVIIHK